MKRNVSRVLLAAVVGLAAWVGRPCHVMGEAVGNKVADKFVPAGYGEQHLAEGGLLADRMKVNLEGRLLKVEEKALVDGFVHRPGSHPWIGEHAGKFLHAAALTYQYTHDERLKALMDRIANTLIDAQLPDGYLGTYTDDQRWTSWDVWSHKYDLIGLLAWYDVTHDERGLTACKKIGDLLCRTFGDDAPGKRDLSDAGTHEGMAATSVLEPMCELYRHTGDQKYLDFCLYIPRTIERHSKIISTLTDGKSIEKVSNAKSYEMMSNLVGLVELYRLTGDEKFLVPAVKGWESIVKDHLYISGTTSAFEHFKGPNELPAGAPDNVGEGCVTVTWEQLNLSLLKLTGEAKYGDQLERTIYNALLAAQNAENGDICYFTPLVGPKPYTHGICCCLSSEPRGIALIPSAVGGVEGNAIVINLYAAGEATYTVPAAADGKPVKVKVTTATEFPRSGEIKLSFAPDREVGFDVMLRQPAWSNGGKDEYKKVAIEAGKKEYELTLDVSPRVIAGGQSYPTSLAIQRGPEVLALDPAVNPGLPIPTAATVTDPRSIQTAGKDVYSFVGACSIPDTGKNEITVAETRLKLMTYANATKPIVWMPTKEKLPTGDLPVTFGGTEEQSRPRQHLVWMPDQGAFTDLRVDTYRTTLNRRKVDQDWYSVELKKPARVRRVAFTQGPVNADGGWFDTSGGKPQIQVKTAAADGGWKTVAKLDSYPATTATDAKGVKAGDVFEAALPGAQEVTAIRLVGKGAEGNNPKANYSSCAELAGYAEEKK